MLEQEQCESMDIRALIDHGLREATAGVCIHWALLEPTADGVLSYFENTGGLLRYESDLESNIKRLSALIEATDKLEANQRTEIRELVGQIRSVRDDRHRVVHGLWGKDGDGAIQSVFPALKRN